MYCELKIKAKNILKILLLVSFIAIALANIRGYGAFVDELNKYIINNGISNHELHTLFKNFSIHSFICLIFISIVILFLVKFFTGKFNLKYWAISTFILILAIIGGIGFWLYDLSLSASSYKTIITCVLPLTIFLSSTLIFFFIKLPDEALLKIFSYKK